MRRLPCPLSVTLPPPSRTTCGPLALRTLAVAVIRMVTGSGPQSKVMMPPAATARMTAAEVQLSGLPLPTVRVGFDVSTARPAAGTVTRPLALPVPRAPLEAPGGVGLALAGGLLPSPV